MNIVVMADIMCAIFTGISLISQFSDWNNAKSAKALRLCSLMVFLWTIIDAAAFLLVHSGLPDSLIWCIYFLAYTWGPIVFVTFIRYCYRYISERCEIRKWVFLVPIMIACVIEVITIMAFLAGNIVLIQNSTVQIMEGLPSSALLLNVAALLYLPIAAMTKRKELGLKAVSLLGLYGLAPILAIVVLIMTGKDFTVAMAAVSVVIVVSLLQKSETQKKLKDAVIQAEAANQAKTSFLFNMSHDIRTPMNAIMGFRNLLEKYQEDPERRADYLGKIEDASNVLLSILNNVLEMARIEKGTVEMDETAWSAEQFNDTLYSIFHEMMEQKGINFSRKIDVQNHYVFCDPTKLREVFINILSNAYKYTNPGGFVTMILEEIPSERPGYAMYRTTITDTGIGIGEDFLPHVFDEFARENSTTDAGIEGTGLGMSITKKLVALMQGTIEVESTKGVGTTFIVTIPHKIAEKSNLVEHAGVKVDPKLFVGKRILLTEDNDLNAEIATEILTEAGFVIERAEDGEICLEKLKQAAAGYYDLVLMDIQMPNMNGYDATRAIRALEDNRKAQIKILAMTANAFEEDRREAFRSGMNGHLAKPIKVHELMKALAGMLG